MKLIPLTRGLFAQVDDADYADLVQFRWRAQDGYAVRSLPRVGGKQGIERMHRRLLGLRPGDKWDGEHEDRNPLNNQRFNLRPATRSQNVQNAGLRSDNRSGFKGVSWRADNKKWQAQLNIAGRNRHLGYFPTPELASEFRNLAADMCHGSFACHG
jgi:hypothetical protein